MLVPHDQSLVIDIGATSKEDAVENFGIRIGEPIISDVLSPMTRNMMSDRKGL